MDTKESRLLCLLSGPFLTGLHLPPAHGGLPVSASHLATAASQSGPVSVTAAEPLGGVGGPRPPGRWGSGTSCPPSFPPSLHCPCQQVCFLRGLGTLHGMGSLVPRAWRCPGPGCGW